MAYMSSSYHCGRHKWVKTIPRFPASWIPLAHRAETLNPGRAPCSFGSYALGPSVNTAQFVVLACISIELPETTLMAVDRLDRAASHCLLFWGLGP